MKRAYLYEKEDNKQVRCQLCNVSCVIDEGKRGNCGVRENREGELYALTYEKPSSSSIDPIEKKPLFHFKPGTRAFSIATVGCNFNCNFCQNWRISQAGKDNKKIQGRKLTVDQAVEQASQKSDGIAYTYTEPTVFFEYAYDLAEKAKEKGLYNVFVSNGYMTAKAIEKIAPYLDAINIDLKAMNDKFYRDLCGVSSHQPVLNAIRKFKELDVWVEVTNLLIPGWNTEKEKIRELTDWLAEEIGREVPLHLSRFHPAHAMGDSKPTPRETLDKAVSIAEESGLKYVYVGNLRHQRNNTFCPQCGAKVITRQGYSISFALKDGNQCPHCGYHLDLIS